MKSTLVFALILFNLPSLFAQSKNKIKPCVLKGQLTECPEKYFEIFFKDKNGQPLIDTINLDVKGNFYLKTFKVTHPQRISIQHNKTQINDLFVAPGYNLTITANAKDFNTLRKTKNISGIGSESNRYTLLLDSILFERADNINLYKINEPGLLLFNKNNKWLQDSIAHTVFN